MKLVRTVFIAMAVMLPVSWTVAQAGETAAPAAEGEKKDKKAKGSETAPAAGAEKTEKKAEKK